MATTTKKSPAGKSTSGKEKAPVQPAATQESKILDEVTATETPETDSTAPTAEPVRPAPAKKVEVSLNDIVYAQSCFHGKLFYKSKRNGSIV